MQNVFDKGKLKTLLIDYYDRIRDKNTSESTIPYDHTIQLYDNTLVTSKPRIVVPYAYQSEIFKQLNELLEKDITEYSDNPGKKTKDTIRLCCDFRKLNAKTIPKSLPIPKAENNLDDVNEADGFIVLDFNSVYLYIPIKEWLN